MDVSELAAEQSYFDNAEVWRRKSELDAADAVRAAAHPGAAARIAKLLRRKVREPGDGIEQVAVGRMDLDDGEVYYVGRQLITDGQREALVISWTSEMGRRYYVDPADPKGVRRKREFQCAGNTIRSYADVLFDALIQELLNDSPSAEFTDALLAELERDRGPELRDIVATIHATQYELISAPLDEVLVVDGGPGTGKTVVALHRIAWLLANHPDRLTPEQVLVVGPNPTFVSYTELVLPSLGTVTVNQLDIGALAPEVKRGRPEPDELARLKGDARMGGLLTRALDARIGAPEATERLAVGSGYLILPGDELSQALAGARMADLPYAQRRERLREALRALVEVRLGTGMPAGRIASLDNLLARLWPPLSPSALVAELFNSRRRLAAAGAGHFTDLELAALHRRAADRISQEVWSAADLALLDEADWLINGRPTVTYAHIAVDEVQDLSPMQLRSVARRCSTGSLTIAGDLAQATGPAAAHSWAEVLEHLPARTPARVVPLRYGYRVPREVYEFAAQLLPIVAPDGIAPVPIRSGPAGPRIHQVDVDTRIPEVIRVAREHADAGRFVGVICPPEHHDALAAALDASLISWQDADNGQLGTRVNLVSPRAAKGLEFDAVVVVEPADIVAGDRDGHRLLYVAFTRTTRYLDVVCVGEALPLSAPAPVATPVVPAPRPSGETLAAFGREVAEAIRRAYPPELWLAILQAAADELDNTDAGTGRHAAAPPAQRTR